MKRGKESQGKAEKVEKEERWSRGRGKKGEGVENEHLRAR